VLRFDGKEAILKPHDDESLRFDGDMTFELSARLNGPVMALWAVIFGDEHDFSFYHCNYHSLLLWYVDRNPDHRIESSLVPVDRNILGNDWSHIAVVVEYPRCRFYHDGQLVRDGYMPLPGIANNVNLPFRIAEKTPLDLDEFRLYRRALTAAEIAAHAQGEEISPQPAQELAIEPHWYDDIVTVRLTCKNGDYSGHTAEISLLGGNNKPITGPQTAVLAESSPDSGRFVASVTFPLESLAGQKLDAVAKLTDSDGRAAGTVVRHAWLSQPDWVRSPEGHLDGVPAPWSPVQAESTANAAEVRVWGRSYQFSKAPLPVQIETGGAEILQAPIELTGLADNQAIAWRDGRVELTHRSDIEARLKQSLDSDALTLSVDTTIQYDGYIIFDCQLQARHDVLLNELTLEIPLHTRYAQLCTGDRVLPFDQEIAMAEFYGGEVRGDLAFRFSPTIWLGNERRGLVWQAESDEHWHYADEQKAIEILPRDETTTFRAHLIDIPTKLAKDDTIQYKFALQATPIKPMLRDSWDLRIMRAEPYGLDLGLPDRRVDGKPEIEHLADIGMRHLFTTVCDLWPYPLPVSDRYSRLLHRLNNEMHAHGLKIHNYQVHERYAVMAPEFDIHGLHMSMRPMQQYIPGNSPPGSSRPGPVGVEYGANSKGTVMFCPKSAALRDAVVHSVARRLDIYGDDGVYLDGTCQTPPCQNLAHGCGYRDPDGSIRKTFPVFATRKLMRRIYNVVKRRRPEGIVDVHASFGFTPPTLAYADMHWTGEQWHHLRGKGTSHISSEMTLDKFRAEFMGIPIGVATETLSYRLGSPMKVAAVSLLHDVPIRPNPADPEHWKNSSGRNYSRTMIELWKIRDRFDAKNARKLFYWENQDYVRVSPDNCWTTLLHHPRNGVLAMVSNLNTDSRSVEVQLNLESLGLAGHSLEAVNALTDEPLEVSEGCFSTPLETEEWTYVWIRPVAQK